MKDMYGNKLNIGDEVAFTVYGGVNVPFLEGWRKLQELLEKVNNLLSKGKEVEL